MSEHIVQVRTRAECSATHRIERGAILVCNLMAGHDGSRHYDEGDRVFWEEAGGNRPAPPASSDADLMHEDLRQLLRALGMFDGARPESPHEVMQKAIAEAARLRGEPS